MSTDPQAFQLSIDGMHCMACVRRVRAAVEKLPGVAIADLAIGSLTGTTAGTTSVADVVAAIGQAGFTASPRAS